MKATLTILFSLLLTQGAFAQLIADPTTWSYEAKKKSANEYELIFHLTLNKGWHIYSLHPGGDGFEMAPSFTFDKDANIQIKDSVAERGTPVVTTMEGIDGKITYFTDKVDFVQTVIANGSRKFTGEQVYQVCSDKLCLPPKYKKFEFDIK